MRLLLASSSLKKKYILESIGFTVLMSNPKVKKITENNKYSQRNLWDFSWIKAHDTANIYYQKFSKIVYPILSTDSVIVYNREIIKKPNTIEDFKNVIYTLSGETHQIATSFTIIWLNYIVNKIIITNITLKKMNKKTIENYISSKMWYKNFNSYNIYESDAVLIRSINGSYSNILGLPIKDILAALNSITCLKGHCITKNAK